MDPRPHDQPPPSDRRRARPDFVDRPHPRRFGPGHRGFEEAMVAHRRAVERGDVGYVDPVSGLFAMTASALFERGFCCDRGCRHCPWSADLSPPDVTD